MPLVQGQVEHLARPDRSLLSPKEKDSLTSKVKAEIAHIGPAIDSGKLRSAAVDSNSEVGVTGANGVVGGTGLTGVTR